MFSGVLHCQRSECGQVPAPGLQILPRNYGQTACNVQGIRREAGRHKFEPISPSAHQRPSPAGRAPARRRAQRARSGRCLVGASRILTSHMPASFSRAFFFRSSSDNSRMTSSQAERSRSENQQQASQSISAFTPDPKLATTRTVVAAEQTPLFGSAPTPPVNLS